MKTILSLFDYSGNWSRPYRENGYNVIQIDIQLGQDIMSFDYKKIESVYGILTAIPCTDFALTGAASFKQKDLNGATEKSVILVYKTIEIINYFKPMFWVIENPMSRIHKCVPILGNVKFKFHPYEFAGYDPNVVDSQYSKFTWLWGEFNNPIKKPLKSLYDGLTWKDSKRIPSNMFVSDKKQYIQNLRSKTPLGFAYAFFNANN